VNELVGARDSGIAVLLETAKGFQVTKPLICVAGFPMYGSAYYCQMTVADMQRHGVPATILLLVYDKPVDFQGSKNYVKAMVAAQFGELKIDHDVTMQAFDYTHGKHDAVPLPGDCQQALGRINGAAICTYLADPRVIVATSVLPWKFKMDAGDDTLIDIDRADEAGQIGVMITAASTMH
jgi:hypothetical protein